MSSEEEEVAGFSGFRGARRRRVSLSARSLVVSEPLSPGETLPLVMRPEVAGLDAAAWALAARDEIDASLLKHGAILFRGFDLEGVGQFEQFVKAVSPALVEYRERSSPRTQVASAIYTSTDYPSHQSIHFHNELSYARAWPMKLWFFCKRPAEQGGATPLADGRRVLGLLDPRVVERFAEKKVVYMRNYGDGFGLTWQTAFQTTDKADVESYCRRNGVQFEWKDGGRLRTRQVFDPVARHPRTGERLWFEHAAFFHISSLPPDVRDTLLAGLGEEELPFNTYYGDGSPIEASVLEEIRAAYARLAVTFPWRRGDVLLIDNMLVSHAREPFSGPREILVAMAEMHAGGATPDPA